ncbi:MAG: hypothetical protein ACYCZ2_04495 [Lutibacter sp.]
MDKNIFEGSSAFGIMHQFQECVPKLKSEILTNKIKLNGNTNDYLNLIINEIQNRDYDQNAGLFYIDKWLEKFNITIDDILKGNIGGKEIYKYIEADMDTFPRRSEDRDIASLVQNNFLQYFCKYYADEVIDFCNKNKPEQKETEQKNKTLSKPFTDIYLNEFCKSLDNYRAIYETSFMVLYDNSITHFTPYFKEEILNNILTLKDSKKNLYIDYVLNHIQNTLDINKQADIQYLLKDNNESLDDYPYFNKGQLYKKLCTYVNAHHHTDKERDYLEGLQLSFFEYAAKIEVEGIIDFLQDLREAQSLEINVKMKKIKWIGKPSQLGYLIGSLAELDYIETPKNKDGEINYTQFSKDLIEIFDIKTTYQSLSKYLNLDSDKAQETKRKFEKEDFYIPNRKIVS